MAIHAVSNIDKFAPNLNLLMLHERVYAFLLPVQFCCVLFAAPALTKRNLTLVGLVCLAVSCIATAFDTRKFDPIAAIAGLPIAYISALAPSGAWLVVFVVTSLCTVAWITLGPRRLRLLLLIGIGFSLLLRAGIYGDLHRRYWWQASSPTPRFVPPHLGPNRLLYVLADHNITPTLFLSMMDNRAKQVPLTRHDLHTLMSHLAATPIRLVVPADAPPLMFTRPRELVVERFSQLNAVMYELHPLTAK